jgi:hypothetical protein
MYGSTDVRAVSQRDGREAGVLQQTAGNSDAIDATVVLLASPGDRILTSDPGDIARLAEAAGNRAIVVPLLAASLSAHRTMINGSALCAALAVTERD